MCREYLGLTRQDDEHGHFNNTKSLNLFVLPSPLVGRTFDIEGIDSSDIHNDISMHAEMKHAKATISLVNKARPK